MRYCQNTSSLAVLTGLVCLLSLPANAKQLPGSISRLLDKYGIPLSAVSLDIREAASQRRLLSLNSTIPRNPASVMKLLTTLSALEILGPEHQWETRYWANGAISNGVITGDLILQGGGDPFITADRFRHHIWSIRQRGIHTITGDLVIDNSLFDLPAHNPADFDGRPSRLYNVGPDAALVNLSATRFVIHPMADGIIVFADPPLAGLEVKNNIQPESGKCTHRGRGWSYGVHRQGGKVIAAFKGKYRIRCGQYSIARSVVSNHEYTFRLFKFLWIHSGGIFNGGYRIGTTPENANAITRQPSETLAEVITSINKYSNNVMSRQLLLSLDTPDAHRPATIGGARTAIRNWLSRRVAAMPDLIIDNGSGLSRKSRITAANLSTILHAGWISNYRPEFLSSLPLAALDGTMRKRLRGSAVHGRARIKTGLINGVRSMAGYVNADNNKQYTVAMMIESSSVNYRNGNAIQDAVLEWIYQRG